MALPPTNLLFFPLPPSPIGLMEDLSQTLPEASKVGGCTINLHWKCDDGVLVVVGTLPIFLSVFDWCTWQWLPLPIGASHPIPLGLLRH
ncbi:hypothetical protein CRG98_042638 [Punica granatum]|uniref:Uncharacterized protein n=1 Tax=Punica granatum TaxID=22663 RepID=A0A2I0HZ18_PUNGR|nr:hypothetical protein CRG98_042638 [Punica granatum]